MLRFTATLALRQGRQFILKQPLNQLASKSSADLSALTRSFSTLLRLSNGPSQRTPFTVSAQQQSVQPIGTSLLTAVKPLALPQHQQQQPSRTVIKFSLRKGKRKSVKPVIKRFKRLDWGGWIRTMSGRHKHMWKKSAPRKRRLRQHVMVNATQATLLDSMVTRYWKRPKYYVNDPYTPYHTREEFRETRRKPLKG